MKILKTLFLACLVSLGLPLPLHAKDQWSPPLNLFAPSILAGWQEGWTVKNDVLSADSLKPSLGTAFTLGDFELEFNCLVENDSGCQINFSNPWMPLFPFYASFKLVDEKSTKEFDPYLAPQLGEIIKISASVDHRVRVRRQGVSVLVKVDEREDVSLPTSATTTTRTSITPRERLYPGFKALGVGKVSLSQFHVRQAVGQPIFNGRDLTGWWTPGNLASWPVIDGNLVCINQKGDYLRTEKEYGNFVLSFDFKMAKRGNSGVGIRTPRDGWPSGEGMELQIQDDPLDDPLERHQMMSIYGRIEPLARADRSEQWNHVVIQAEGRMIFAWVNGVLVQQYDTGRNPDLKHRPLKGWIGFQDHGARTEFRDVRVLELPDGDYGYQFLPNTSAIVIDRLMNLETLAARRALSERAINFHQIATRVSRSHVEDNQEHVLLNVDGPGAIVGINRHGEQGKLNFYFDGQQEPDLVCPAKDLASHLPSLGPDRQPMAIYLPFRSSLKVTLQDGAGVSYRFDYLAFDPNMQGSPLLEDYRGPDTTLPRGLLSTVTRRIEDLSHGGHREHDGLQHFTSESKNIERGQTVALAELTGAGIVEWWKLKASNKVLSEDNLWVQVTVDGETTPAIEAPARFFFPGLPNQKNYQNFVITQRNGFINWLAMPYRAGLKISAMNRGKKAIKDVGLMLSTNVMTEASKVPPLRLHGQFATASQPDIINQSGYGRWIGLIYGLGQDPLPKVEELIVDGQPRDGWADDTLANILGVSDATGDVQERHVLCGRDAKLAWRWLFLAPVDFQKSLVLKPANSQKLNDRLALFYLEK